MKRKPVRYKPPQENRFSSNADELASTFHLQNKDSTSIPFAKVFVAIAVSLLLLAAARALFCPVPLSPAGMSFVKWTLGMAIAVLCGVGITRHFQA